MVKELFALMIISIIQSILSMSLNSNMNFTDISKANEVIDLFEKKYDKEVLDSICIISNYTEECYSYVYDIVYKFQIIDVDDLQNNKELKSAATEYNSKLSHLYFIKGDIEYLGMFSGKPDILSGIIHFIISGYIGNPDALYKLYVILNSDIISFYYVKLQEISSQLPLLNIILHDKNYLSNFDYQDNSEKSNIANLLLYSSALYKNANALNTLAYKLIKGIGIKKDCQAGKLYYKESATNTINYYHKINKPNFYEKYNMASTEYVGYKYTQPEGSTNDITQLIEYYKVEASKGMISHINHLGQRFLFGQGIEQDFSQAIYYFKQGSHLNDTTSMFYLGEMYLNGWGVEQNYTEAIKLYNKCIKDGYTKAYNSLGYMYYYGLSVEKNIKRAYDYFLTSIRSNPDDSDSYFNLVTILTEDNGEIEVDITNAHKYASIIGSKGHTFGTYYLASMNEYKLGAVIDSCDVNVEFYRSVAERVMESKRKFDLGYRLYQEGNIKSASLVYLELAEEGHLFAETNLALLFSNYDIFVNTTYNNMNSFKYLERAMNSNSAISTLYLADSYFKG
jgi:TPR repeat protein